MNLISILWLPFLVLLIYEIRYKRTSLLSPIIVFISLSILNYPLRIFYLSQGNLSINGRELSLNIILEPAIYGFIALCSFTFGWYISIKKILNLKVIYYLFYSSIKFQGVKKLISKKSSFLRIVFLIFLLSSISIFLLVQKANTNIITYIIQSNYFRLGVNQSSQFLKLGLNIASFIASYYGFILFKKRKIIYSLLIQIPTVLISTIFAHRGLAFTAFLISFAPFEIFDLIKKRYLVYLTPLLYFLNAFYSTYRDSVYRSLIGDFKNNTNYFTALLNNSINAGMHGIDSLTLSVMFIKDGLFKSFSLRPFIEFLYPLKPWFKFLPNPTHIGFNRLLQGDDYDSIIQNNFVGGIIETLEGWSYLHFGFLGILFVPFLLAFFMRNIINAAIFINSEFYPKLNKDRILWLASFYSLFFFLTVMSSPAVAVSKTILFSIIIRLII